MAPVVSCGIENKFHLQRHEADRACSGVGNRSLLPKSDSNSRLNTDVFKQWASVRVFRLPLLFASNKVPVSYDRNNLMWRAFLLAAEPYELQAPQFLEIIS